MTSSRTLARRTDPATSHEAARRNVGSGANGSQKTRVLEALRANPGATSAELARAMGVDRAMTARRLSDLEGDELVHKGPARECRANGGSAVTWRLVADGPAQRSLFFAHPDEHLSAAIPPRASPSATPHPTSESTSEASARPLAKREE